MSPTAIALSRRNALGGAVVPSSALAADTFNRANGALNGSACDTGGQIWTANADFVITSNQLACTVGNVAETLADINVGTPDQRVVLTRVVNGTNYATGVRARVTDSSNYYFAGVGANGDGVLYKKVANVFTLLGTVPNFTYGNGDEVGVSAIGTTIKLYKNGVAVVTVTDSALATGNRAGIRANSPGTAWRGDSFAVYAS